MADDGGFADAVRQRSQQLVDAIASPANQEIIGTNAGVITKHYSIEAVGERLVGLYEALLKSNSDAISSASALPAIDLVNLNRPFYPCRTETFSDA
jgi:hypothetical protein